MTMSLKKITGLESAEEIEEIVYSPGGIEEISLPKHAVLALIDRFLSDQISSGDLERIAEALDVNERILIDDDDRTEIAKAIFRMSSTEINGPLTVERVASIRKTLAT